MTRRLLAIPFAGTSLLFAISFFPRIANQPLMRMAFWAACAVLLAWQLVLWARPGLTLSLRFVPVRTHWVQALVQFSIYLYWGSAWQPVYDFMPALFGQVVFLYVFDMLLQWTRRREWIAGFGPFPITFSTNFFMWFRDEWFLLQFAQLAIGSLGKEFVRWNRDGRSCHIFNPSAFSLMVSSVVLLTFGLTSDITWAREIAASFEAPELIRPWIFIAGLVVQSLFRVTLVTAGAVFALLVINAIQTVGASGTEFYGIPAAVFLGLHLLVTDPATSPRTLTGKGIFGMLYGALVFPLFYGLQAVGAPTLYDKLLSVPILNLSVKWIDSITNADFLRRLRERVTLSPARLNWIHMGAWVVLFVFMFRTDRFAAKTHRGLTVGFWSAECDQGRPAACETYLQLVSTLKTEGNAEGWNRFGMILTEGKLLPADPAAGIQHFKESCRLGALAGCQNTVQQFIFVQRGTGFDEGIAAALARLESASGRDAQSPFLLGIAYAEGFGVPRDNDRARQLFKEACDRGDKRACTVLTRPAPRSVTP